MSVFEAVLSKVPGFKHHNDDELESLEEGTRHPLTGQLRSQLIKYFPGLDESKLEGLTFEKRQTTYEGASYDLYVYDAQGHLKFQGRSFHSASPHFWTP